MQIQSFSCFGVKFRIWIIEKTTFFSEIQLDWNLDCRAPSAVGCLETKQLELNCIPLAVCWFIADLMLKVNTPNLFARQVYISISQRQFVLLEVI